MEIVVDTSIFNNLHTCMYCLYVLIIFYLSTLEHFFLFSSYLISKDQGEKKQEAHKHFLAINKLEQSFIIKSR